MSAYSRPRSPSSGDVARCATRVKHHYGSLTSRRRSGSECPPLERKKRPPADRYTPQALLRAIRRACRRAHVETFTPYSLRHLRAVELRARFGLETTRAVLGHSATSMAAHYSQSADAALASIAATTV